MNGVHFSHIFIGAVVNIFALIPCVLVMQILMPRPVLERYWKEPHFRPFELEFFSGAFAPLRTFMLMWVVAFPGFGKARDLVTAYRLVPVWYRALSAVLTLWFLTAGSLMIAILVGFTLHDYLK